MKKSIGRILVSAATEKIPEALLNQLKAPGVMVLPVKDVIVQIKKDATGEISEKEFPGFVFVPLR